jgi:hypothetical protein
MAAEACTGHWKQDYSVGEAVLDGVRWWVAESYITSKYTSIYKASQTQSSLHSVASVSRTLKLWPPFQAPSLHNPAR